MRSAFFTDEAAATAFKTRIIRRWGGKYRDSQCQGGCDKQARYDFPKVHGFYSLK